jgi:hypothetical protein
LRVDIFGNFIEVIFSPLWLQNFTYNFWVEFFFLCAINITCCIFFLQYIYKYFRVDIFGNFIEVIFSPLWLQNFTYNFWVEFFFLCAINITCCIFFLQYIYKYFRVDIFGNFIEVIFSPLWLQNFTYNFWVEFFFLCRFYITCCIFFLQYIYKYLRIDIFGNFIEVIFSPLWLQNSTCNFWVEFFFLCGLYITCCIFLCNT